MFTPNQSLSVALLPKDFIYNTNILFLPHPRNGSQSPFIISLIDFPTISQFGDFENFVPL